MVAVVVLAAVVAVLGLVPLFVPITQLVAGFIL
jgi:hypothetical protein